MFYTVKEGRLTLQEAALFFYLSQRTIAPVSEFFKQVLGIQTMLGGAAQIMEMFHTKSSMIDGTRKPEDLKTGIAFKNVSFSYEKDKQVLRNVNLDIRRGEMTAIVGPSGSGKSTLTDLLLRLYDVDSGLVLYDSIDVRDFIQESYRQKFGVVAQECLLFNATVRDNIVYNREENDEALEHAIWASNAGEFIRNLPFGVDTLIGDRGTRLSGGQRQRIAIARAVYGHPSILILDEATSALDSESERNVQEAIDRISKEVTTIVIAHRLSTVTHADKIVVLNDGVIEAVGPHSQLLKTSPTYRHLYDLQFAKV
jgi:subfamily B ATP-binding cassette protein MsbA